MTDYTVARNMTAQESRMTVGHLIDEIDDLASHVTNRSLTIREAVDPRPEDPQEPGYASSSLISKLEQIRDRLRKANQYTSQACESLGV